MKHLGIILTKTGEQLGGKQVPANPGDKLTMHYKTAPA
jgi:hypothetical protein